jgi:hypothetical protein
MGEKALGGAELFSVNVNPIESGVRLGDRGRRRAYRYGTPTRRMKFDEGHLLDQWRARHARFNL